MHAKFSEKMQKHESGKLEDFKGNSEVHMQWSVVLGVLVAKFLFAKTDH